MIALAEAGNMAVRISTRDILRAVNLAALVLVAIGGLVATVHAQTTGTSTTVTSSLNPSAFGQNVTFTTRVRPLTGAIPPTGTVTVTDTTAGAVLGVSALAAVTQAKLDAGSNHTCSLDSTGGVSCWGDNLFGQLGDGTTTDRLTPVGVSGLSSGVTAIAAGRSHSCALTTAGAVLCWGDNSFGQIGDGTTTDRLTPVLVSGLSSGVAAISISTNEHSCALTIAGAVLCWGNNFAGQLGDGTTTGRLAPVAVSGLSSNVAAITTGSIHSCAVTTAGAVLCWGNNSLGQLGDGTRTGRLTPVGVSGLSSGVTAIAGASSHSCALTTAGAVLCWGLGSSGQLGDGTTTGRLTPGPASGLSNGATAIAAGDGHSCALTTAGAVLCWGDNFFGQVGDGTTTNRLTPVFVSSLSSGATAIASGDGHSCALTMTGTVRCWGFNSDGQLGDGTTTTRLTPVTALHPADIAATVATSGLTAGAHAIQAFYLGNAGFIGSSSPLLTQLVNKAASTIAFPALANTPLGNIGPVPSAIASSGLAISYTSTTAPVCTTTAAGIITLVSVGTCSITAAQAGNANFLAAAPVTRSFSVTPATTATTLTSSLNPSTFGQSVSFTARVSATSSSAAPTGTVTITDTTNAAVIGTPTLTPVTQTRLAAGAAHTCSVSSEGGLSCWGFNSSGQLGDGTTTNQQTPVPVSGLSIDVLAVSAGRGHGCAATAKDEFLCWGDNANGQLGDGTTISRLTPVQVSGLTSGVAAVSTGGVHSCALTPGGALFCWGSNGSGQIGDGTTTDRLTPVSVSGLSSGVAAVSAGNLHSCALTTAGAVRCWGFNVSGRLGDGTTTQQQTPVPVSGLSSGVVAVAAGGEHSCALTTAGAVRCWGSNFAGQLGDGTTTTRLTPVPVSGLSSGVAAISVDNAHSCALTTAGAVLCWGGNFFGQLGDGTTTNRLTPVPVSGLASGVAAISGGDNHSCALTTAGAVRCWGANADGGLGDGTTTDRLTPVATLHPGVSLATIATSGLAAGSHAMRANYAGNASFLASASPILTQTVNKGANVITFPALANRALGTTAPVPAATASSGLAVTYTSTTTAICTVTTGGVITLRAIGACSITASQAGNGNFLAATPVVRSFSVTPAASTSTVTTSGSPRTFGAAVTFTATVSATAGGTPTGSVTFRDGAVSLGVRTLAGGTATLTTTALGVGAHSITVVYGGSTVHASSTSAALTQTVTKATTTTTLTAAPNPAPVNGAVTLSAVVSGLGATGSVAFRNGATTIANVALTNGAAATTFTPTAAGTLPISAVYSGNPSFVGSTSSTLGLLAHIPCSNAFVGAPTLAGANGSAFGSTVGATGETGEPNHAGNSGALNSVWCRWTAPAAGTVTIDTTGSSFDTTLGVYTGAAVNALTQVAANDNIAAGNTRSRVTFAATQGTVYRIAIDGVSATGTYVLNIAQAATAPTTVASVLPTARSITTKTVATAFATMVNAGAAAATGCSLSAPPGFPATFSYQATNPANAPIGTVNTPQTIAAGAAQGFVFSVTPLVDLNSAELAIVFDCTNTPTTITVPGLNTLLLSASSTPSPDLISIGSTPSGDGIANIPGNTGSTAFGAATVNIGAAGTITASVDDNGRGLALTALLCVTNPTTGACTNPATPAASATFALAANASATVAVFVTGTGNVPFDPGANRLFLRFKTADGVTRGATSVAVRTQ
jgi:alpha-tubulin suppressor-like RCC1 family protein